MSESVRRIARLRVPIGFVLAVVVFWLAAPTTTLIAWGGLLATAGEALRVWAAGHLNKSNEVTSSGPYRLFAHPLYVGSAVVGAGLAVAAGSVGAAIVIALYLATTITAAIKREEAFLRDKFGDDYDRYRRGDMYGAAVTRERGRRFSLPRAMANREYRAIVGLVGAALLLLLKATL